MNPFTHRPGDNEDDWEDNGLSNSIAWLSSVTGLAAAIEDGDHWMVRLTLYLWAECPVCLFFRGAAFGALVATLAFAVISMLT